MLCFFIWISGKNLLFCALPQNIAECHIIIYGGDCSVDQSFTVSVAPVDVQTIFQRNAANQFTDAAAISLAEGMNDVQSLRT